MKIFITSLLFVAATAFATSREYVYNYNAFPPGTTTAGLVRDSLNSTRAKLDSVSKVAAHAITELDTLHPKVNAIFPAMVSADQADSAYTDQREAAVMVWAAGEFTSPADVGSIISSQVPGMLTGLETTAGAQAKADTAQARAVRQSDSIAGTKYTTPAYVTGALAGALSLYATRAEVADSGALYRAFCSVVAHDTVSARLAPYMTASQVLASIGDTASALRILISALPSRAVMRADADSIAIYRSQWPRQTGWTGSTGTGYKGAFNASASTTVGAVVVLGVSLPVYADVQNLSALVLEARQRIKAIEDALKEWKVPGP